MSQDPNTRNDAAGVDRLELHYRQQLSALVDGALAPDEARFLLRRLEHDQELADGYERWQLYGEALRGGLGRMAAPGFAAAVAVAIREEGVQVAATGTHDGARRGWVRWGGGAAALAASVAVVALFMGQGRGPGLEAGIPATTVASTPDLPARSVEVEPAPLPAVPEPQPITHLAATEPEATAARPAPRPARVQPVAREPLPMVASVREVVAPAASSEVDSGAVVASLPAAPFAGQATAQDPFASAATPHARPWPRAVLAQPSGAFTASFGGAGAQSGQASRPFYPFEPALPANDGDGNAPAQAGGAPAEDSPSR